MKNVMFLMIGLIALVMTSCSSNDRVIPLVMTSLYIEPSNDRVIAQKTEETMKEATRQIGMPAIVNFQGKKNLIWIYELCDQENLVYHAYLFSEIGQYLGKCIFYNMPYSTQFSNPVVYYCNGTTLPQAEPNGLFKPDGVSATWLIMIDPTTKK
jgi:hypothetical protein